MVRAFRLVTGGRQRGGGKLESRVIGDVELPIGNQPRSPAGLKISVRDGEQVDDFLMARPVFPEPSELQPILQGHFRRRSRRSSGQPPHSKGSADLSQVYDETPAWNKPTGSPHAQAPV